MRDLRRVRATTATPTIIATIPTLIHIEPDPFTPPIIGGIKRLSQAEPIGRLHHGTTKITKVTKITTRK
jgi:hypothetical protein